MIVYAKECADSVLDEIVPLMIAHDQEIVDDITRAWPLEVDVDRYRLVEAAGMLRVFTARDEGELVGYATFMVVASIHRKSLVVAHEDALYLKPDQRKAGVARRLMDFAEDSLSAECVMVMYHSPCGNPRFGTLLARSGYTKYSEHYARRLTWHAPPLSPQ